MSTRSLTFVYDSNDKPIINMYRHCDGYPTGHGAELAEFLQDVRIVNGLDGSRGPKANGMVCLAAQIVCRFKNGPGGVYLYPVKTRNVCQDYEYHVRKNQIDVYKCYSKRRKKIFSGTWREFGLWCKMHDE